MTIGTELPPKLFQPARVGDISPAHRVVLAPLGRCRANKDHVHTDLAVTYYSQRSSVPGTLLVAEATPMAPFAGGMIEHMPSIVNAEQVAGWKKVVDAVHANGSFIFLQLWAPGRTASQAALRAEGLPHIGPSAIGLKARPDEVPRPLTTAEIKDYIDWYVRSARNAVFGAGFDGVEVHGAHGYLIDQFIQDVSNQRTDEYGGSIENRCRFALEVVDAVATAVGESRTAFRISPWNTYMDMRMEDPVPTFAYLVSRLAQDYPSLAYLHVVEPGVAGAESITAKQGESNDFIRKIWLPRPFISAGRYTRESAMKRAEETGELIAFGRRFLANPDLPLRLRKNLPLNDWSREHFYTYEDPHGYIDYPFAEDSV